MSCLFDITQGVIYEKVMQQLNCYYQNIKFVIKPVSRIFTNNVVYRVTAIECELTLCVKVYLNSKNVSYRFATEKNFTNYYFCEIHHLENARFICLQDNDIYGISIRQWIEGKSAMEKLLKSPKQFVNEDVNKIIHLMNKVWEYTEGSEPFQYLKLNSENQIYSLDHYISTTIIKILNQCDRLLAKRGSIGKLITDLNQEINFAYRNKNFYDTKMTIINSDPSLHEFFFHEDKIIWIDWEYVKLGSKLVDTASFYYSLANNFWRDDQLNDMFLTFITKEMYIDNRNLFGLFLLEKVITCDEFTGYIEPVEKLQWGLEKSMCFLQERV